MQVREIFDKLNKLAPVTTAMDFDNVGLLVGDMEAEVTRVAVALDCTPDSIAYAAANGANVLVTHHPVIFHPIKALTPQEVSFHALQSGINVICMHTNLDVAEGGVNDCLADALDVWETGPLCADGLGRIGTLIPPMSDEQLAAYVKERLGANGVRYNKSGKLHTVVAVGGGACGDLWREAQAGGATALISGEAKYNDFLDAQMAGFTIIAAGHFATENVVCAPLADYIRQTGAEVLLCPANDVEVFY